MIIIGLQS